MKLALIVGIGSFFGGIGRYLLSMFVQQKTTIGFPYGTLTVNLIGCFIIGCLYGISEKLQMSLEWRLFFITGLVGGFTTFSAFSVETHHLIKSGHIWMAITYIVTSVVFGVCLTFLGAWLFRFAPAQL